LAASAIASLNIIKDVADKPRAPQIERQVGGRPQQQAGLWLTAIAVDG
jgi:hypothetical protein